MAEEVVLGEIKEMIKGERVKESAEEVVWTQQCRVREAK